MFEQLKADYAFLKKGQSGSRFKDFLKHKHRHQLSRKPVARTITFVIGLLLLIGGLAIGWLPGPGGFIALIGLALLSREIPGIANALDFCELTLRNGLWIFLRLPIWVRFATGIIALGICGFSFWLIYHYLF